MSDNRRSVGEWIKTAEVRPPVTERETLLVCTYTGQLVFCGFDGTSFFNTFMRNGEEMISEWTATGAPYWCMVNRP